MTYCRKITQREDTEQGGFPACSVSDDDQLPVEAVEVRIYGCDKGTDGVEQMVISVVMVAYLRMTF